MKILISGQHLNIGDSLKSHIEEQVNKHVKKYFELAINAHITLVKEKSFIRTEIIINQGTGSDIVIKSSAEDNDAYRSFDLAIQKIDKQLQKHKTRLKKHYTDKEQRALIDAKHYLISSFTENEPVEDGAPAIIAEKVTRVEKLSVGEAVMKMDLLDLPTLVFINSSNNHVNVVYYRKDGNIAWMDLPIL